MILCANRQIVYNDTVSALLPTRPKGKKLADEARIVAN